MKKMKKKKALSPSKTVAKFDKELLPPLSQPHFWKSVRMTLTLPKWGLGSPSRLLKFQSLIARVKTPRLEAFFISLKRYRSVDVENGLA